jgi:hypothetical protein
MAPVFSLVLDKDVSEDLALLYPELYKELIKVGHPECVRVYRPLTPFPACRDGPCRQKLSLNGSLSASTKVNDNAHLFSGKELNVR